MVGGHEVEDRYARSLLSLPFFLPPSTIFVVWLFDSLSYTTSSLGLTHLITPNNPLPNPNPNPTSTNPNLPPPPPPLQPPLPHRDSQKQAIALTQQWQNLHVKGRGENRLEQRWRR